MKSTTQVSVLRSVLIGMTIMGLLSCAEHPRKPLEQKYTAGQLREMLTEPMPQCVKDQCDLKKGSIRCWLHEPYMGKFVQPEACLDDYRKWQIRIADRHDALERRYSTDAATAPACIRERTVSRKFFEMTEVDPDATDAMAQALAHGAVVPFADPRCMAEVCQWRARVEPTERSPYCAMVSRNLAAGDNLETKSA